jgi:hypothetical protein
MLLLSSSISLAKMASDLGSFAASARELVMVRHWGSPVCLAGLSGRELTLVSFDRCRHQGGRFPARQGDQGNCQG